MFKILIALAIGFIFGYSLCGVLTANDEKGNKK